MAVKFIKLHRDIIITIYDTPRPDVISLSRPQNEVIEVAISGDEEYPPDGPDWILRKGLKSQGEGGTEADPPQSKPKRNRKPSKKAEE